MIKRSIATLVMTLLLALLAPLPANAGGVALVGDARVSQYKDALAGAHDVLRDAATVDASAADAAEQLKRLEPAAILAVGQKALQTARAAAPSTPVIYCMVIGNGIAPSRTITGVRLEVAPALQLEQLKQVNPGAHRIGVIYQSQVSAAFLEEAVQASGRLGLTLITRPVQDAKEVRTAVAEIAGGIDVLWLMPDPRLISAEMFNYLLVFTLERKVALFGFSDSFTQAGALLSVAPDYQEIGRRAARMAAEAVQRAGAPLPPATTSPGALTVNLKTARQLGIEIPQSVLSKARQVYR
jgi:putative ABC transport system substrate-binding protein